HHVVLVLDLLSAGFDGAKATGDGAPLDGGIAEHVDFLPVLAVTEDFHPVHLFLAGAEELQVGNTAGDRRMVGRDGNDVIGPEGGEGVHVVGERGLDVGVVQV